MNTHKNQSIIDILQSMDWKKTFAKLLCQLFKRRQYDKRNEQLFQLLRVRAIIVHIGHTVIRLIMISLNSGLFSDT